MLEKSEKEIASILASSKGKPIIRLSLEGTIKDGFTNLDMPIQSITGRYSSKAILSIDASRLVSPAVEDSIEDIRGNRAGSLPIKELGMGLFISKLKDLKFGDPTKASELFEILSSSSSKDKVIKEAEEFLNP